MDWTFKIDDGLHRCPAFGSSQTRTTRSLSSPLSSDTPNEREHVAWVSCQCIKSGRDAVGSVRCERPQHRPADEDSHSTERERDEDIQPGLDTAVNENRRATVDRGDNLFQGKGAGDRSIELPTAVIGDDDAVGAGIETCDGCISAKNTLHQNRQATHLLEPVDRFEPDRGILRGPSASTPGLR